MFYLNFFNWQLNPGKVCFTIYISVDQAWHWAISFICNCLVIVWTVTRITRFFYNAVRWLGMTVSLSGSAVAVWQFPYHDWNASQCGAHAMRCLRNVCSQSQWGARAVLSTTIEALCLICLIQSEDLEDTQTYARSFKEVTFQVSHCTGAQCHQSYKTVMWENASHLPTISTEVQYFVSSVLLQN